MVKKVRRTFGVKLFDEKQAVRIDICIGSVKAWCSRGKSGGYAPEVLSVALNDRVNFLSRSIKTYLQSLRELFADTQIEGQAHFASTTAQNQPVPYSFPA